MTSQRTGLFFSLFFAVIFGWAEYILSYYKQNEELLDPTIQVKIFFRQKIYMEHSRLGRYHGYKHRFRARQRPVISGKNYPPP